ncbi:MAG TPA: hypothetical protein GX530_10465 [Corynebacteriales bacterium]|nr:hypothetical protein [Mycobacteriales bacterium]
MSKKSRINTQEIASRFISSIPNERENEVEEKRVEIKTEKKEVKKTRPFIKDGGYSQRAYYITDEQYRELKILAVENDTDTSSLVREALDQFLNKR